MECAGRAKRRRRFPPSAERSLSSLNHSPESDPLHRTPKRHRRFSLARSGSIVAFELQANEIRYDTESATLG